MAINGFFKSTSNTDQIPEKKTDPEGAEQQDKDYAAQEMPSTYGEYGAHNVLVGHHVSYAAGDHQGKGKVVATGEHGCTVCDSTGREHRVFWHEVSGHHGGEKDAPSVEKQTKTSEHEEHEGEKMNKALGGAAMIKGFVFTNESGQVVGVGGADQFLKAHVKGYTRGDGVFVAEHDDSRPDAQQKPAGGADHSEVLGLTPETPDQTKDHALAAGAKYRSNVAVFSSKDAAHRYADRAMNSKGSAFVMKHDGHPHHVVVSGADAQRMARNGYKHVK